MKTRSNFSQNNLNNITGYCVPLTAALIICRVFPVLSFFYYAVPFILFLTLALSLTPNLHHYPNLSLRIADRQLKILLLLITAFGIWAAVTSAWSPFPEISLSRAVYFLLMSIAPVIMGYLWIKNRHNEVFGFLLPANIIVIVVSIYSLLTNSPVDSWTGGHGLGFKGYASHQNALASAIVFTIPSVLFPIISSLRTYYLSKKNLNGSSSLLTRRSSAEPDISRFPFHDSFLTFRLLPFFILILLNLYILLISVSRAGLLALIIIITLFILLGFSNKIKTVFLLILIPSFIILYNTNQSVREFIFKTETTIGARRSPNIIETIEAAKDGGLFGLGYGISREPLDKKVVGRYERDGKVFIREKMIGTLALIEETGIIGMCLFLAPLVYVIWLLVGKVRGVKREKGESKYEGRGKISLRAGLAGDKMGAAIMIAVIVAFSVHAQIEAWWVGVGSIELPIFFLVIGSSIRNIDFTRTNFLSNEQN